MRRVLLVTYYFPPAGGVPGQRVLKFARYLPSFGYLPTVVTVKPEHAAYGATDESLLAQIPEEVEIVRTRSWDPLSTYARLRGLKKAEVSSVSMATDPEKNWMRGLDRWIRGNIFLPDARAGWVPYAVGASRKLIRKVNYSAIITSGPPHSTHLVGKRLKAQTGIPWIADFRDPWTDYVLNSTYRQSNLAKWINTLMEKSVLTSADAVLSVSEFIGRRLQEKAFLNKYETIENGFDSDDFSFPHCEQAGRDRFVLAYVGTYSGESHPQRLPPVVSALDTQIEVRLVGSINASVVNDWEEAGLQDSLRLIPPVPHSEALKHMSEADLLLLLIPKGLHNEGIVTGKLFEYLAAGRPVMAIGPPEGDMARILRDTKGGRVFDYHDDRGMFSFLENQLNSFMAGKKPSQPDCKALKQYERRALTGRLAQVIELLQNH